MALDLEKLSSAWEPKLRDAFLAAIRSITDRANLSVITRLLEHGDLDAAFRALNIDPADFSQFALVHQQAFNDGGAAAAKTIFADRTAGRAFDPRSFQCAKPIRRIVG